MKGFMTTRFGSVALASGIINGAIGAWPLVHAYALSENGRNLFMVIFSFLLSGSMAYAITRVCLSERGVELMTSAVLPIAKGVLNKAKRRKGA